MNTNRFLRLIASLLNEKAKEENKPVDEDKEYKDSLNKYCDDLGQAVDKSNEQYEKQLSFISAGALGLSFVLIEKVLKDFFKTDFQWMIFTGWAMLAATLMLNLASHQIAILFHTKSIAETRKYISDSTNSLDREALLKRYNVINKINIAALILLAMGLIFILLYTSLNLALHKEDPEKPKPTTIEIPANAKMNITVLKVTDTIYIDTLHKEVKDSTK